MENGRLLLLAVANWYETDLHRWVRGSAHWATGQSGSMYIKRCCIDVALLALGPRYGGLCAEEEARKIFCTYLRRPAGSESVMDYTDWAGRTVGDVIRDLRSAAHSVHLKLLAA